MKNMKIPKIAHLISPTASLSRRGGRRHRKLKTRGEAGVRNDIRNNFVTCLYRYKF